MEEEQQQQQEEPKPKSATTPTPPTPTPTPTPTSKRTIKKRRCYSPEPPSSKQSVEAERAKTSTRKRKRLSIDPNKVKANLVTLQRAEEVQSTLDPKIPSFLKCVQPSHVSSSFWMGLPSQFCKMHLPRRDMLMTVVDDNGGEFPIKYLTENPALSGGWRAFSVAHQLVEGDVLIFLLIEPTKFKVKIIKALPEDDGAQEPQDTDPQEERVPSPLDTDASAKKEDTEHSAGKVSETGEEPRRKRKNKEHNSKRIKGKEMKITIIPSRKHQKSISLPILDEKIQSNLNLAMPTEQNGNDPEMGDSEVLNGTKSSGSTIEFKDVKNFKSFTIMVNGVAIDSEISENTRRKYYELCCTQKAFLHEHLVEPINSKLVAGIISEIVNITDAIKSSTLDTPRNEFNTWGKSLMAFEHMGMNVGFIQYQLQRLVNIAFESELVEASKRCKEVAVEKAHIKEQLDELHETSKSLDAEIEALKAKILVDQQNFQAMVKSLW